jgi:hypothetical protein
MFFMVIERFKPGSTSLIGERFKRSGRMLPEGVTYHASWVDSIASRCFQIMEAANPDLLRSWASHWDDLIDFEIVPVLASADFWASVHPEPPRSGPSGHGVILDFRLATPYSRSSTCDLRYSNAALPFPVLNLPFRI